MGGMTESDVRAKPLLGSLLFVVVVPGTVAVLIPGLMTRWTSSEWGPWPLVVAIAMALIGFLGLFWTRELAKKQKQKAQGSGPSADAGTGNADGDDAGGSTDSSSPGSKLDHAVVRGG